MLLYEGKYYLYRHIRPDKNEVFYIGVGTKTKDDIKYGYYTRSKVSSKRNKYWKNIVNLNPNYDVEILLESDDYNFILTKEIEFIKLYGRRNLGLGTLCNLTNGGDGQLFRKQSKETREKISKWHTGRKRPLEIIIKIRNSKLGSKNHQSRKIINIITGVIYDTCKEAALKNKINVSTLSGYLRGRRTNKSNLKYLNENETRSRHKRKNN